MSPCFAPAGLKVVTYNPVLRERGEKNDALRCRCKRIVVEEAMQKRQWNRRAGGVLSVLYLLIFAWFEAFSAIGTALDKNPSFPSWEHLIGWALLVLPSTLLASLFLLHWRRPRLGFLVIVVNLCLYASFMIFESVAFDETPVSPRAIWELSGIWAVLFLTAVLAARFLETKALTKDS